MGAGLASILNCVHLFVMATLTVGELDDVIIDGGGDTMRLRRENSPIEQRHLVAAERDDPQPEEDMDNDDSVFDFMRFAAADTNLSIWLHQQLMLKIGNKSNGTLMFGSDPFHSAVDYLILYFTPVIIVVGIIGNALSLSVFSFTHLQRISSSLYLSTLSIADILFLLALLIVWLERIDNLLFNREGWCQSVLYTTRVSGFVAAWSVVSFTGERYVTVYHPLRKDKLCTKRKARMVVLSLTLAPLLIYSYIFWTYDVVRFPGMRPLCAPLPRHVYLIPIMTSVDTLFSCLTPSVLIIVLNFRIIVKIHRYQSQTTAFNTAAAAAAAAGGGVGAAATDGQNRRRSIVQTSVSASGSMHIKFSSNKICQLRHQPHHQHHQQQHQQMLQLQPLAGSHANRLSATAASVAVIPQSHPGPDRIRRLLRGQSQYRTSRMLLILSSLTVLLNLPTHIFRVHSDIQQLIGGSEKAPRHKFKWQELFELVYFLNFAVNFFVYSACGRQFRTGLGRLCSRAKLNLHRCSSTVYYGGCRRRLARSKRDAGFNA